MIEEHEEVHEKRTRKERKLDKIAADRRDELKHVLSTQLGRRFMWHLLGNGRLFMSSYIPGQAIEHTAFLEGMRNNTLALFNDIMQYCAEEYFLMLKENGG